MAPRPVAVTLSLSGEAPTSGLALLEDRTLPARAWRAGRALLGAWAAAAASVLLPIVHFVLVPVLVLTGLVLAVVRLREDRALVQLTGACPRCRGPGRFSGAGRFREGREVHCDGCGCQVAVRTC